MLCGLLLIATGFAMRPVLGRAGALAFAALIAISPSMTYFSRGGSTVIASLTLMMVAITIAESMRRRPTVLRAAGLGVAIAMWLTADPIGYVTGGRDDRVADSGRRGRRCAARPSALALARMVGPSPRASHRLRDRRDRLVVHADDGFFHRPLVASVEYDLHAAFAPPSIAFHRAIRRLIPILVFYEFIVVALAIVGAIAIVSRRIGDRFAAWSVVWAIVSLAMIRGGGRESN